MSAWENPSRVDSYVGELTFKISRSVYHPRFFDEQLGSAVGAIDYVRGSEN